ncbi:MAG: DUF1540 domain-containing protein [Clostridium sp.]|nr:DUF1540 domain-containing protein [Clostridium sp.]
MTRLDCNVTGCVHNSENCCCRNSITVEGKAATEKCGTCCASFDENKGQMFKNMFKTPESQLRVACEAENCVYNKDKFCAADHIGITGGNAVEAHQTECSSFKAR